jgi:hypothetical protein
MSVAAHVSRVSKDYAPHGFSVMNRAKASVNEGAGGIAAKPIGESGLPILYPILYADQGGLWVEAVQFLFPAGYDPGGAGDPDLNNKWFFMLCSSPMPSAAYPGWFGDIQSIVGWDTFSGVSSNGSPFIANPGANYPSVVPPNDGAHFTGHFVPDGQFLSLMILGYKDNVGGTGPAADLLADLTIRYRSLA